jgi:hypothetical protein
MNPATWSAALLLAALGGCGPFRMATVAPGTVRESLPFLDPGISPRSRIVEALGKPSYESAEDRVISYRMIRDGFGTLLVQHRSGRFGWRDIQYNLVLAFDECDILEEFALIQLKEDSAW